MRSNGIPITQAWGIRLAFGTAMISGVAVWLNASAVRTVGDPAVYTTLKNLAAALILIGAAALLGGASDARRLQRSQWMRLVVIGLVGGSIPFLLFFTGLSLATAPSAAFIHKTLFVWVALLAVPLLGERLGWAQIAALGVLFLSQVLVVGPTAGGDFGPGEAMILAATLLWSVEVIVAKRLLSDVSPSLVGAARLGIGVVVLIGYVLVTGKATVVSTLGAEAFAWVALTGVILAAYVGTWYAALRRAPATIVTAVLVVGAVVTIGLEAISSGSYLDPRVIIGVGGILAAAVLLAVAARLPHPHDIGAGTVASGHERS